MLVVERRNRILELLYKNKKISVHELEKLLKVSACTIRNDLVKLEQDGLIERTHGGAVMPKHFHHDLSFSFRQGRNQEEKDVICDRALEFLERVQCVILDASSTSLTLAKKINSHNKITETLTVITNGLYTAQELKDNPGINVILIGGVVRPKSGSLEGLLGKGLLSQINADIAFVSAQGFTLEEGLTDFNVYEAELKRQMVTRARRVIALLDNTKIDKISIASFAKPKQVDTIITDDRSSEEILSHYREANINVIICKS